MLNKKIGIVLNITSNKTALVATKFSFINAKYKIVLTKTKNYLVHDEKNVCKEGMIVLFKNNCRVSKKKSWSLYKNYN